MSDVTIDNNPLIQNTELAHDQTKVYLITVALLLLLTVIEYLIGKWNTTDTKITLLVLFSLMKAILIVAIFMHVKYETSWKTILIAGFLIPLIMVSYLFAVLYIDFGVVAGN